MEQGQDFAAEVTIRRRRFTSEASGFAVLEAEAGGDEVVLVGPLVHLEERERARIRGRWVYDSRYGEQVKVSEAHPLPPSDEDALLSYLRRVRHIGPKRAEVLLARYGPDAILEKIDVDPPAAFRSIGLTSGRARESTESWNRLRVTRQLHLMLAPHGLAYLSGRLQEAYGARAHMVVASDPYELTSVFGVGFATADRIARSVAPGVAATPGGRRRAAIVHVLAEAERRGSTCMPLGQLIAAARELLAARAATDASGTPTEPEPWAPDHDELLDESAIEELVDRGDLVRDGDWLYRTPTAEAEGELADRVHELVRGRPQRRLRRIGAGDAAGHPGGQLTREQAGAVAFAFQHRLSVITGGPGTGKTATIRAIAQLATRHGLNLMLVAPTGRAATRMSEASGTPARTVHSALGWVPGRGPAHDQESPLECDLLVVDECSMTNQELMLAVLRALGPRAHMVLVGDADQLAPVGAGKPFAELVACGVVPTTRLTHIFRQAAGSMIVQGAHAIKRGSAPSFRPEPTMRRDLFLIERSDPLEARAEIVSLVCERLPAHYGVDPVADIQIFAPVYKGPLGIDALNADLRSALNPSGRAVRGGRLRIGDKVMMAGRNLHELGLMNGTLLRLVDELAGGGEDPALLLSSEDSMFRLPLEEANSLLLAYACSVHRGQGIELPIALLVAHASSGAYFLRREMLYTAVTRARVATVIVGSADVVTRAARTPDTGRRHSRLAERLAELRGVMRP